MSTTRLDKIFEVKCKDCDFETEVDTLGSFEHVANEHINYDDGFGYSYYGHTVVAHAGWAVRRNI
jgi:hypothetical protein